MLALLDQTDGPFIASGPEALIAKTAAERLSAIASAKQDIKLVVQEDPKVVLPLPARAVDLIFRVLQTMGEGVPFSLIPHEAELTTQQAADFLNVSRPFISNLVDIGEIKARKVGTHRRIRFVDLTEYQVASDKKRRAAILKMAEEENSLNLD